MDEEARGRLIVISGPSGVGKTTLCQRVLEQVPARLSVSATTRPPRRNETDGVNYYFLSVDEFERRRSAGEFLEWAKVHGHLYGTPLAAVQAAVKSGQPILLEIDVQGGIQVRHNCPDALGVFILPPALKAWRNQLRSRLTTRGLDEAKEIERRLDEAEAEINQARQSGAYTYFVVNDDLEQAVKELVAIIDKELNRHD